MQIRDGWKIPVEVIVNLRAEGGLVNSESVVQTQKFCVAIGGGFEQLLSLEQATGKGFRGEAICLCKAGRAQLRSQVALSTCQAQEMQKEPSAVRGQPSALRKSRVLYIFGDCCDEVWTVVQKRQVEAEANSMAYFKIVLSAVAALLLAEFIGLWSMFRGISTEKATGLAVVVSVLFSPLFWLLAIVLFGLFFYAGRLGSKGLRILLFWTPTLLLSTIGILMTAFFFFVFLHFPRQ